MKKDESELKKESIKIGSVIGRVESLLNKAGVLIQNNNLHYTLIGLVEGSSVVKSSVNLHVACTHALTLKLMSQSFEDQCKQRLFGTEEKDEEIKIKKEKDTKYIG